MLRLLRPAFFAVLLMSFAFPAAAQTRAGNLTPIIPANNAILTTPPFFTVINTVPDQNGGDPGVGYTLYIVIEATKGSYRYKEHLQVGECCTSISPNDFDYQLVNGKSYKWHVVAENDATHEVVDSSPKQKFSLDMANYKTKITVQAPDDGQTTTMTELESVPTNFLFQSHGLNEYRVVLTRKGEFFGASEWTNGSCVGPNCMVTYTFVDLNPKTYKLKWKIEGRYKDVTGKAVSVARAFKLVVTAAP